ncbi:MAG: hypothetical protein AAGG08_17330, partial [Actinomycetota bacterium]
MNARHHDRTRTSTLTLPAQHIGRRRFLALAGGLVAVGAACSQAGPVGSGGSGSKGTSTTSPPTDASPPTTAPGRVTTIEAAATDTPVGGADDHVLVVVNLDGGNDAVNTLVPDLGSVHDLRPSLAIDEGALVRSAALPAHGLHPALAGLIPRIETGTAAVVAGVGFPDADRSHFVSTDRWDRADRMETTHGWLGRWLDGLPGGDDLPRLAATSLGGTGAVLVGADRRGTTIGEIDAFAAL